MTSPAPPDEEDNSTRKGASEPTDEHHASSEKPYIESHVLESTSASQPEDAKSLDGQESLSVKDEMNSSGSHELQDDGNTHSSAGAEGPITRLPLPQSQPPAPEQTEIDNRFLEAARNGNWEAVSTEIKSKAHLGATTPYFRETALHLACRLGNHDFLQNLLKQDSIKNNLKEHMEERDIDKWTPLHSACSHNETGFKRLFEIIDEDFDDDVSMISQSQSHTMAERTQKTLDILFDSQEHFDAKFKFDINARDREGKTALHMACRYSSVKVVALLVKNGAEVNVKDTFDNTPLMEACRHHSGDIIDFLLGQSAEVNVTNKHNSSPLTLACQYLKEEDAAVVKHLLDANANCDWADNDKDTPLILASKFGKTVMVREILKHKHKPKDLSKKNKKGQSAWKCAISNEKARDDLVPLLLNGGCTIDKQDASILFPRQTTESFSGNDLQQSVWLKIIRGMLLECNQPTDTDLSVTIEPLLRYASKEEKVFATIGAESETHFKILYEATKELGLHENICKLIRASQKGMEPEQRAEMIEDMIWREFSDEDISDEDTYEMYRFLIRRGLPRTPLQFSAMHGDYMLVWYLLKTSHFGGSDDIKRAMEIAKGKKPPGGTTRVKPESNSQPKKDSGKQRGEMNSKRYKRTINMLQNAAAISSMPKQPPKKLPTRPKTEEMQDKEPHLQKHNATVVDFYKRERGEDGPVKLLRASPSVFDLVYANTRVDHIMKTAKTTFNEMVIVTRNNDMNNERKPQLRWIHLPANNMDWMEHLTIRVYDEKKDEKKWSSFFQLAQRSRVELPTDGSDIKFMKPICIKEEQLQKPDNSKSTLVESTSHGDNSHQSQDFDDLEGLFEEGSEDLEHDITESSAGSPQEEASERATPRMALYAPYITFGYCDVSQQKNPHTKYGELKKMYQGSILHGSRSLDRFYYNALSQEKMDKRDRSQVVTRGLLGKDGAPEGTKWPYLTVDQLWIWVVDEDTIITSSTHREDEFDDLLVERIFHQLRQGSGKGSGQKTPTSATEMGHFLISSCVDFMGKLTWKDVCREDDDKIQEDAKNKPVLLLFADKLNEAMAREKDLFQKFRERVEVEKKNSRNRGPRQKLLQSNTANLDPANGDIGNVELGPEEARKDNLKDWDAVHSAAELLDEVKDIRDELVILRFLVTQQEHVWSGLMGTDPDNHDARSPRFTGEELDDMIKMTDTIQKSVNELINLEENSISIKESMVSCEQSEQLVNLGRNAKKQSEQLVTLAKRADQQSEENARQERILMLFTFVTIVFTPLSFMASYYALNTTTARHNNDGELEYEPGWMNRRIFGTSAGIIGPLLFYASLGTIMSFPARIKWLVQYKSVIQSLMKSKGLMSTLKAVLDVREYVRYRGREKFVIDAEKGQRVFHP